MWITSHYNVISHLTDIHELVKMDSAPDSPKHRRFRQATPTTDTTGIPSSDHHWQALSLLQPDLGSVLHVAMKATPSTDEVLSAAPTRVCRFAARAYDSTNFPC